ncbi:chloride channel-like protein clc-g [Hordeum vulgare]|nr:chloride channel-like protein clc-g [Hordeum vulgare]
MSSWNDEDSSDEDICMVSMDQQLFETPDTVVDPSFCGSFLESEPMCMMHHQRPKKMVAFEGSLTGRRFLGCRVQQDEGVNCGVVEWVDGRWPEILQRCLGRIWDMYQEQNIDIIQNMRKAMKEVHVNRDLLKEEKKKLEYLIADLLKAGHGSKDKLERIKAIVDE